MSGNRVELYFDAKCMLEKFFGEICAHVTLLGKCKTKLLAFYNARMAEHTGKMENDDWYDTLEIFSVRIWVGKNGEISSAVSAGDNYFQDHILDIEIEHETIVSMSYDG